MAKAKANTPTSEVLEEVSPEGSTSEVELDTLTLDKYLTMVRVNPGLVASFRHEAYVVGLGNSLEVKTADDWQAALLAQSNRFYD